MTLDEACSDLEKLFGGVRIDKVWPLPVIVCSGALGVAGRPPPVLCINRELAVTFWSRAVRDYAADIVGDNKASRYELIWITEPEILTYKMTLEDVMSAQRVATPRFAVYSVLAISELTQNVASEDVTPATGGIIPARRARGPGQKKRRSAA